MNRLDVHERKEKMNISFVLSFDYKHVMCCFLRNKIRLAIIYGLKMIDCIIACNTNRNISVPSLT